MATEVIKSSQLRIEYNQGIDLDGNPIYKTKNYNNLKTTATPDHIQSVALAIANLQQHSIFSVQRNSHYVIVAG
ncbi:MAG TPA: DUF1659 domain-containing protein [Bacillus bacterium]|nr:DUF1659 domain-containing protein [Bacillus sp. (in: firmicutes)]